MTVGFDVLVSAARGRWRSILPGLAPLNRRHLSGRNGPCPMCGGRDRWRFTDRDGRGTWWCNACGHGDGFDLLEALTGRSRREVMRMIEDECGAGRHPANDVRPSLSDDERKALLVALWRASRPVTADDVAGRYLASRGLLRGANRYPEDLRFCSMCEVKGVSGVQALPAMVALVRDPTGKGTTLHRTYLAADGSDKALIPSPKRVMPGAIAKGSAVRLAEPVGGLLGIAEGIETALAAAGMWRIPVWAALNSAMLEQWTPPEGVQRVVILADNDQNFAGHKAAYALAHRLAMKPEPEALDVQVWVPPTLGCDWADEWVRTVAEDVRAAQ